jgi:hypothetical protein
MAWEWPRWTCGLAALLALPAATAASIELQLVEAPAGRPVTGLVPQLLRLDGAPVPAPLALVAGRWRFDGLAAGALRACARSDADEWIDECQGGQQLPFTGVLDAVQAIEVAHDDALVLTLALDRGGTLTGIVTDRHRAQPLADAAMALTLFNFAGNQSSTRALATDAEGRYRVSGLRAGAYRLQMRGVAPHYTPMRYPGIDCIEDTDCAGSAGSYVGVNGAGVTDNLGFDLFPGTVVPGTVRDAMTQAPLAGIEVVAWQADGPGGLAAVARATTGADGRYELAHLLPGVPARLGTANRSARLDRGWPDAPCPGVDCTGGSDVGTPHGIAANAHDFALPAARGLAGSIAVLGAPTQGAAVQVTVFRLEGGLAVPAWSGAATGNATYATRGFAPGTYFARAQVAGGSCVEWIGQACPPAGAAPDPASATPIVLAGGAGVTPGIDFTLAVDALFGDGFEAP